MGARARVRVMTDPLSVRHTPPRPPPNETNPKQNLKLYST
jgi:hypothetical protein